MSGEDMTFLSCYGIALAPNSGDGVGFRRVQVGRHQNAGMEMDVGPEGGVRVVDLHWSGWRGGCWGRHGHCTITQRLHKWSYVDGDGIQEGELFVHLWN